VASSPVTQAEVERFQAMRIPVWANKILRGDPRFERLLAKLK
jgi:hypothetical protein